MEAIFISGIIGFIGGGVLMFFMKDKITSEVSVIDQTLHHKVDALSAQVVTVGQQVANHVTQQVQSIAPKSTP